LPPWIAQFFDKWWFRLIFFFLIVYTAQKNPTVAILTAVGFMISVETLNRIKFNNSMAASVAQAEQAAAMEPMQDVSGPVAVAEGPVMDAGSLSEEDLAELAAEGKVVTGNGAGSVMPGSLHPSGVGCNVNANFRNSFYPQYVNMKPDAYTARYSGDEVNGYDPIAKYASL